MKLKALIPVIALLTLSCARIQPVEPEDSSSRIVFNRPFMGSRTRAIITGSSYPTTLNFRVWGYYSLTPDINPANPVITGVFSGIEYIAGRECVREDTYWVPTYTASDGNPGYYYWKSGGGYMTFHAMSPASVIPGHSWETGFSLDSYTVEASGDFTDLLYSHYTTPRQKSEYSEGDGVDIVFHHMLAAVKFIVRESSDFKDGGGNPSIKVKKLELMDAYRTGSFEENRADGLLSAAYSAAPEWTPDVESQHNYTLYQDAVGTALTWNSSLDKGNDIILADPVLVLPQPLDHSADGKGKVAVRITYRVSGESEDRTVSGTLSGLLDSGSNSILTWDMGKRYTYAVLVGKHKISFSPGVEDWDNGGEIWEFPE